MDNRYKTAGELFTLPERPKSTANSERAMIVGDILERLNTERIGTKWKPLTARAVAIKVGHVPTNELRDFYKACTIADCGFSKAFFGRLKV